MKDLLRMIAKSISEDEEKVMEDAIKGILKEESDCDDSELMIDAELIVEAMVSNDEKVTAMGESIIALCNIEKFTPFELGSMSATLLCEACRGRAKVKGIESTKEFYKTMVSSMNDAMEDIFKEIEEDDKCEDSDCECKCE